MKLSLFLCLILASTALAKPRPKRSFGHIKNLIVNKLFGIGGKTVIVARPILSKNETYQLFRIPGINDLLIKVSKNDKKHENDEKNKPTQEIKEPVIVKPEVAIIGSYLGTTTQKETALAIEMVKNLIQSGILTGRLDNSIQKLLIPQGFGGYIGEGVLTQPMQVITENEGQIFVPEYPELFVPPKLKPTNTNSKYYYKQEGPDADMTYESYDNKDVFVTRTNKQPQNLRLKVSDAAKNVGNSNLDPISQPLRINGPPATYYANEGMIAGGIRLPMQNEISLYNGQIPPPGYYVNQGLISGMSGKGPNPPPGYYVNQGSATGGILGQMPYGAPTHNVNSGMIGNAQGNLGNAHPMHNVNPNLVARIGQIQQSSVYNVNPYTMGGIPGQIPPYLSHGISKPNVNDVGQQYNGNNVNGGTLLADRNPPLQMNAMVHPYHLGNKAQRVFICNEQEKACPSDKSEKTTSNTSHNGNKAAVNQQSIDNNSSLANAKNRVVSEFLKNHTINGQIVTHYSYQQVNTHSNKNYTDAAVTETHIDLNKDFVYIPPGDSSIDLTLNKEGNSGNNNKNAFTSYVKNNKGEIKRFMASNRLKSNASNYKQNPIVVADIEKRSNEKGDKVTKPDESTKVQIPGSTF